LKLPIAGAGLVNFLYSIHLVPKLFAKIGVKMSVATLVYQIEKLQQIIRGVVEQERDAIGSKDNCGGLV
jgi:hypothetical protein